MCLVSPSNEHQRLLHLKYTPTYDGWPMLTLRLDRDSLVFQVTIDRWEPVPISAKKLLSMDVSKAASKAYFMAAHTAVWADLCCFFWTSIPQYGIWQPNSEDIKAYSIWNQELVAFRNTIILTSYMLATNLGHYTATTSLMLKHTTDDCATSNLRTMWWDALSDTAMGAGCQDLSMFGGPFCVAQTPK